MLLCRWLIQLYHVVQEFLGPLKNVHLERALELSRQHVMYETEYCQANFLSKSGEIYDSNFLLQECMIGGSGLLWVICMAAKPGSLRMFYIQSALSLGILGRWAEVPPVFSINEWPRWHFGCLACYIGSVLTGENTNKSLRLETCPSGSYSGNLEEK